MLELILTRPQERPLIAAAKNLHFLVLDELHTYRGRQGADVAMLVRRTREAFAAKHLQCVGTSATLAGAGTYDAQRAEVARVTSMIFGAPVQQEHVLGETLRRATPDPALTDPQFLQCLRKRIEDPHAAPPKARLALPRKLAPGGSSAPRRAASLTLKGRQHSSVTL